MAKRSVFDKYLPDFEHINEFFVLKEAIQQESGTVNFVLKCQKCLPKKKIKSISYAKYSNLRKHIVGSHPSILSKYEAAKSSTLPSNTLPSKNLASGSKTEKPENFFARNVSKNDVKNAICDYIIERNEPFKIVRDKAFKKFVNRLQPNTQIPSYQTVMKTIDEKFEKMMNSIKECLENVDYVAFSTDGWSSVNKSFLGYTITWLNEDLERVIVVVACERFIGRHTYDQVGAHILKTLNKFGILSRTVGGTTDGAGEYSKAFREVKWSSTDTDSDAPVDQNVPEQVNFEEAPVLLDPVKKFNISDALSCKESKEPEGEDNDIGLPFHVICMSHSINNVATTDAKKALDDDKTYKRVYRKFFSKMESLTSRSSTQKSDKIRKICGSLFIKPGTTRWNSEHDSLEDLVAKLATREDNFDELMIELGLQKFTKEEIAFVKEYVMVMKPLAVTLDVLQADNIGLGHCLPNIVSLRNNLIDILTEKCLEFCKPLVKAILVGIEKRFSHYFIDDYYILSALTVPMFKTYWINTSDEKIRAINILKEEVKNIAPVQDMDQSNDAQAPVNSYNFGNNYEVEDQTDSEVDLYLSSADKSLELLKRFPRICQIYRKYNTIFIGSASVERVFSKGKLVFELKRHSLLDENFEKQLILNCNKDLNVLKQE